MPLMLKEQTRNFLKSSNFSLSLQLSDLEKECLKFLIFT